MNPREVLTPREIASLKSQGYSDQEIYELASSAVSEEPTQQSALEQSYNEAMALQQRDPRAMASNSMFGGFEHENMVKWQLELDNILERIDHMLRGDKIKFENGHLIWTPAEDETSMVFNDYGVTEIMKILAMYLNRNTILSNYDEATINLKMYDLGNELADLIFLKYEAFGLDTLEKRKLYPMIVREVVDIVHSSYLRALHGGERQSLKEVRQVSQTEAIGAGGVTINTGSGKGERGILNPMRYLAGKYK